MFDNILSIFISAENNSVEETKASPQRKILRSKFDISEKSQKAHVLPSICIICKKKEKVRKVKGRIVHEHLSYCETFDRGNKLVEAAQRKADNAILVQLQGCDYIAIELQYHKSCFTYYTTILDSNEENSTST